MPTTYQNFVSGTLSADPGSGGTSIQGSALADLVAIANPATCWIVLDPEGVNGAPEIVSVTAHTTSATSATVVRAQQGTSARAHPIGTVFQLAFTKADADQLPFKILTTEGDLMYASGAGVAARLAKGTTGLPLVAGASVPGYAALAAAGLATDAVETAKIKDLNVTAAKLAADAVTTAKIQDGAVTSAKITDGTIATADLANGAVTYDKQTFTTCRLSKANTGSSDTPNTDISGWTEDLDASGMYSSGATVTIPDDGWWVIGASAETSGGGNGTQQIVIGSAVCRSATVHDGAGEHFLDVTGYFTSGTTVKYQFWTPGAVLGSGNDLKFNFVRLA